MAYRFLSLACAEKTLQPTRRQWLQSMAVLGLLPVAGHAKPERSELAAAWREGLDCFVGRVALPHADHAAMQILQSVAVPTRAHGMCSGQHGSVVFASRRPGDWLLRLRADGTTQWHWIEPDRAFNGHVIASADGRYLYTTETDLADGQGLLGVRDASSLEKLAEWRTGGMDPHQLLLDHDGSVMVANGGIATQSETGRRKLRMAQMDSSLVRLQPRGAQGLDGEITGQWRLPDTRLSLRHLAWGPQVAWQPTRRWLGIALQAEHDRMEERDRAPVLAMWDGVQLTAPVPPEGAQWQGYGGDISSNEQLFAVSCPRADTLTWWQPPSTSGAQGALVQQHALKGVYALSNPSVDAATQSSSHTLWAAGRQQTQAWPDRAGHAAPSHIHSAQLQDKDMDNHWIPTSLSN